MANTLTDGFFSLFRDVNKVDQAPASQSEGAVGTLTNELTLEMEDSELLDLSSRWEQSYQNYKSTMEKNWKTNEDYWLGKQYGEAEMNSGDRPPVDNRLFMSLETFLPLATRNNPEAIVMADNSEAGIELADAVQKSINWQADRLRMKLKVKQSVRFWALYHLGVGKMFWDADKNDIGFKAIRPQNLILDKDSFVEDGIYLGQYIGELREDTAKDLIGRFPEQEAVITSEVKGNLGTKVKYTEWWTNEYVFWRFRTHILGKSRNPHWNYEGETTSFDEFGQEHAMVTPGKNHFEEPKMPYAFLSVFNVQEGPFDATTPFTQNIGIQDVINRRWKQIDLNANTVNGTWIGSSATISKEALARIKGKPNEKVWLDGDGDANGLRREVGKELPAFVYNNLVDARNEVSNIFGTQGSNPQGIAEESTVRGKIISRSMDADRVSGIADYIEQYMDEVFNWMVQMMYVYYDEPHFASMIGADKATEYVQLDNSMFNQKLLVSVKSGSMVPTDPMTKRNEAVDLYAQGAIDPITLFERLDFPNPRESAKRLLTWDLVKSGALPPQVMFPDFAQVPPVTLESPPGGTQMPEPEQVQPGSDVLGEVPITPQAL